MRKISGYVEIGVLIFALLVGGVVAYFWLTRIPQAEMSSPSEIQNILRVLSPTPTTFPFQELTIPYLRGRTYESSLGELEKLSENPSYTSYVTSYDTDGFKVYGLLTIPRSEKPKAGFPAIVFVHGYILPQEYKTEVNYNSYADYLAKNGIVVFKIDLRGHGSSEGEPGGAYYSGDYVIDTLNAHAALQSTDFVDPKRIGLWGHSMAGNVVFRSFIAKYKQIPAIVIWAGAVYTYEDFSLYRIDDESYKPPPADSLVRKKREELFATYGSFDPESEFWKKVPGTNYLEGVSGAIQINHAVNDDVVSIEYSRNLTKILDSTSIVHELNEYASGGHNLTGTTFVKAMQATFEFFLRNM